MIRKQNPYTPGRKGIVRLSDRTGRPDDDQNTPLDPDAMIRAKAQARNAAVPALKAQPGAASAAYFFRCGNFETVRRRSLCYANVIVVVLCEYRSGDFVGWGRTTRKVLAFAGVSLLLAGPAFATDLAVNAPGLHGDRRRAGVLVDRVLHWR
jgi:hypothetical protein